MGTAQLLYITLGVIVTGLAIVVGMEMVSAYNQETNREQLINHSVQILTKAEEYYKKPVDLGGGGGTYEGFDLSESMLENDYGLFRIRINGNRKRINVNARGVTEGRDGERPVRVIARIIRNNRNPQGVMRILIRN